MGRESEAVAAMRAAESDKSLFNIENDWVGASLLELLQSGPFEGSARDILDALKEADPGLEGKLSTKRLGKRISKLWPHLENVFDARQFVDSHTKTTQYLFSPLRIAGFAGFQTAICQDLPYEGKCERSCEITDLNPANPANPKNGVSEAEWNATFDEMELNLDN